MTWRSRRRGTAQPASGREIAQTLKELARRGLEATYYSCDVNDQENVAAVLGRVVEQYGGIAGVIHGAGIIRDSFIEFMTAADFTKVVEVKLLGAWNLYQAAREHGLRFMVMLSSITAVRGNVGQINYCAGNRAMSALTQVIASQQPAVRTKALMLPPIEGAGMADDPEMRELLRLKGMGEAYITGQRVDRTLRPGTLPGAGSGALGPAGAHPAAAQDGAADAGGTPA